MKRIARGMLGVEQGTVTLFSDFETGGEMWTGTGPRERRTKVRFAEPFLSIPAVHVSLAMIDSERRHNQRMDLSAARITQEGFEIVFKTWDDSKVARARASWLALGEVASEDDWDIR